jgi:hypothetical protein
MRILILTVDPSMGGGGRLRRVLRGRDRGNLAMPLPGGQITGTRWPGRSGAPNAMGKMAKQRGDHVGAHLGQHTTRQTVVAAHGDRAAPLSSGDGGGSTWGSSGSKKMTGSFVATSLSSSQLQLRQVAVNRWCMAAARVWFLWIEI